MTRTELLVALNAAADNLDFRKSEEYYIELERLDQLTLAATKRTRAANLRVRGARWAAKALALTHEADDIQNKWGV